MAKKTRQTDILWGIERDVGSMDYRRVVAPFIMLWQSPAMVRQTVVAVAEHRTEVKIIARVTIEGVDFFHVEPERAEWVGKLRRLRAKFQRRKPSGWVSRNFLKGWGVE